MDFKGLPLDQVKVAILAHEPGRIGVELPLHGGLPGKEYLESLPIGHPSPPRDPGPGG